MKLIVGNWKMFPKTLAEAQKIFTAHKKATRTTTRVRVVVSPPHLFVQSLVAAAKVARVISVGAQDAFWEDEGARTGETSPAALASLGATHVILGHSERRALGERDEMVAKKTVQVVRNKLTAVVCVGERMRDEAGVYFTEVREELRLSLFDFPRAEWKRLVIAYEPIWAIGASAVRAATVADFREMSILIRRELVAQFGKKAGFAIPILYGGSVDERNAEGFLREGEADGLLIGRISLDSMKFGAIITLADKLK